MTYEEAVPIYEQIKSTKLNSLFDDFISAAIRYARIRTDYKIIQLEERQKIESLRTAAHNAFIDACNILSRNMKKAGEDNSWREKIGEDRKIIGDFACYLHCILGILVR